MEEAEVELRSLLQPTGSSSSVLNARYVQALQLLGARSSARRIQQTMAECWRVWAGAQMQRREVHANRAKALGLAPSPLLGPRKTDASLQCTLADADIDRAGNAMAAEITAANDKRAAAERQVLIDVWDKRLVVSLGIGVEELKNKLQAANKELCEVTQALIASKISEAEIKAEKLGLDHDIRKLEKQVRC
ncbi:MAG: hypothetical protein SGPRY_005152 [Prymnesium sp.]